MGSTARAEKDPSLSFALVEGRLTAYRLVGPESRRPGAPMEAPLGAPTDAPPGAPKDAPLVVLLHGLGAAGSTYAAVASRLGRDCRLLIPDLLGSGRSAKPLIDYRPLELAQHIDGLLENLALRAVDMVVGHSQGAAVAVELCRLRARDPATRVARLMLIDPPPPAGVRWLRPVTGMPLGARSAEIVSSLLPHRGLARLWLGFLYADRTQITDDVLTGYTSGSAGRGYAAATARALHSLAHLELRLEDAPMTTLLWGAEDRMFPPALASAWQARLPRSSLTVLPATGHCPHEEQPEAVAFAIRECLAQEPNHVRTA